MSHFDIRRLLPTVINIRDAPRHWRTDPAFVYVGRAGHGLNGIYGNPHPVGWCGRCERHHARVDAIAAFEAEATSLYESSEHYRAQIEQLRGRILVCFCKPKACHRALA